MDVPPVFERGVAHRFDPEERHRDTQRHRPRERQLLNRPVPPHRADFGRSSTGHGDTPLLGTRRESATAAQADPARCGRGRFGGFGGLREISQCQRLYIVDFYYDRT
ncbi:hypothetical protein Psi02_48230 [Planotetraspora silvatica]|uniref:Uncharacterized protein n=1 Tax=Planotetraspora silvatica TaxID=234614 RepID=A0A8J3UM44_9ACTN|nr:hypothetical protein Psi02_48230 [Planotetraspora silvatica]